MSDEVVLITGARGYLGRRLVQHYLDTTDTELVLAVGSSARRAELESTLSLARRRVHYVSGAPDDPEPFAAIGSDVRGRVTAIIHGAAVTRFNVEREVADTLNVEGTSHVLAFARGCPRLERVAHVSTVYATGLRSGPIREDPGEAADDLHGFANHYEWSKWAAEQLVFAEDDLPWCVLRLGTVIADDDDGFVTQYNAFHETLKLCFYGLLPLIPGRGDTPLYCVTGRFAIDAVAQLTQRADVGGIYHVSPDRAGAATLEAVLDLAFEQFGAAEDFRKKRIMRPLLADQESFGLLVEGVSPIAGTLVAQALRNVTPFAPQLYVNKELDNSRLVAALGADVVPDVVPLLANTCRRLVDTRWGRRMVDARR